MKLEFLHEPELEFGADSHIDIRFGLANYGPFDFDNSLAPKEIKVGIIGTPETVEGIQRWLERCRNEIPAKQSRQPHLFRSFPGFSSDASFQSSVIMESRLQRIIPQKLFDNLSRKVQPNEIVAEGVNLFFEEVRYLAENKLGSVIICAVPMVFLESIERLKEAKSDQSDEPQAEDDSDEEARPQHLDFHDMLKARAMSLSVPIQIVLPTTYDETKRRRQKNRPEKMRRVQDEATRAWNFHTALYYKAGGTPWRMKRDNSALTTCYVGISFYETLDRSSLLTSIAQVFNERGDGVVVRGGTATFSKDDRQPHLQSQDAYQLLVGALDRYRREHRTLPARVVLHKSSTYSDEEIDGFANAIQAHRVDSIDLISISDSFTRLFRTGAYPPLRGTFFSLDEESHVLYTKGSVHFFATYPGMYIPLPLGFRCSQTEQTPRFLAQEMLALTKMNWNNTQFDGGQPITQRAAHQVGSILKYVGAHDRIEPRYSFYM